MAYCVLLVSLQRFFGFAQNDNLYVILNVSEGSYMLTRRFFGFAQNDAGV